MTAWTADSDPFPPGHHRGSWPTVLAVITVLAFAVLAISSLVEAAGSEQPATGRATVTVPANAPVVTPVPSGWLGLSTEYWSLPLYARHEALFERVLGLLHTPGTGPLVLRIGGDSADHAFWLPGARGVPTWAAALTPGWTASVAGLVRRQHLRLIIDLNLITGTPAEAADWAAQALRRLPRHSVIGFEIGNEPDIYSHRFWAVTTARTRSAAVTSRALPATFTAAAYAAAFGADARALAHVAPGVPLLGPALARPHSDVSWVSTLLASDGQRLGAISVHRYPYTACAHRRRSPSYPTIARLLGPSASFGMAASLRPALAEASRAGLPLRLTELNSVTCGGRAGVSNTFATALWAPDALFALLRTGVSAVNLHVRANTINAPFALGPRGLTARPLLYGMLLFARALGPSAGLVATHVHARPGLRLNVWSVRSGSHLRLVLVNAGPRAIRARLTLPARGLAVVQRLLAASPHATSGVTFDGQRLNRFGAWTGRAAPSVLRPRPDGYTLLLPRHSAALATVELSAAAQQTAASAG